MEKPITGRNGFDEAFGCGGRNAVGGFYLEVTPADKEIAHAVDNPSPTLEKIPSPSYAPILRSLKIIP